MTDKNKDALKAIKPAVGKTGSPLYSRASGERVYKFAGEHLETIRTALQPIVADCKSNCEIDETLTWLESICKHEQILIKDYARFILPFVEEVKRLKKDNLHFTLENSRLEKMLEKALANVEALQNER